MLTWGILGGIIAGIVLLTVVLTGYVKASTDEAIIISGYKSEPRIITGRSTIKIPFLERRDRLTLRAIKIDVKTQKPVPTNEFIDVSVDSVVVVKISKEAELISEASQNFLNKNEDYIMEMVTDVLEGNIREIIGTMTLRDMISDRKAFGDKVELNAVPDMAKMGIEIISFNVQNFWDENGIIQALGVENTSQITMKAQITKADAEKDIKVAQARANKIANDEEVKSRQEIAVKQHELDVKTAELKKDSRTKEAEADSAYRIQEETQRKTIEVAKANADLAKQEKEIELQERQVRIEEQKLDGTIKKKAEAERYARGQKADAELYEMQKLAEADIANSKADRIKKEENAIGLKAIALAEADGIRAKGLAEAEGLDKKAEAMLKMKDAAILEMFFSVLPQIAENVAKPLENVDSITMYGEGNNSKMIEDITKATNQITNGLTDGLGIDMKSMIAGFLGGKVATGPKQTFIESELGVPIEKDVKIEQDTEVQIKEDSSDDKEDSSDECEE